MSKIHTPRLIHVPLHIDDRGDLYVLGDKNGEGAIGLIKRNYFVRNFDKGRIRAWHGHRTGWTGIHVIKGAAKVVAMNMDDHDDYTIVTLSGRKPGIFWVPPGFYNGHMSLEDDTIYSIYSTLTFEECKQDDPRMALIDDDIDKFFSVRNR